MKRMGVLALAMLAMLAAPAAMATNVGSSVLSNSTSTQYTYTFTSTEANDFLTAFHVFAPVDPEMIVDWTADKDWYFGYDVSQQSGVWDYFWCAPDPDIDGLGNGMSMSVSLSVPSTLHQSDKYVLPGYLGNWGYETKKYADYGITYGVNSLPVPANATTAKVPEPMSLTVLGAGVVGMVLKRRRR